MKNEIAIGLIMAAVGFLITKFKGVGVVTLICGIMILCIDCEIPYAEERAQNGHYYRVISEEANWNDAKVECNKLGGYLVTIADQDEFNIVLNLSRGDICWLGAEKVESEWKWITGEEVDYFAWSENEPNNNSGNENAIVMNLDGSWNDANKLNPYSDAKELSYICEWEHKINFIVGREKHTWSFGIF